MTAICAEGKEIIGSAYAARICRTCRHFLTPAQMLALCKLTFEWQNYRRLGGQQRVYDALVEKGLAERIEWRGLGSDGVYRADYKLTKQRRGKKLLSRNYWQDIETGLVQPMPWRRF